MKKNPCDTCKDVNTYNDYFRKKSNYRELKDKELFNVAYDEGQCYDCRSCEHNKEFKKLYRNIIKNRIETFPNFFTLYNKIERTKPYIINSFKEICARAGTKINFNSKRDYKLFKFYISEYNKRIKSNAI